MKKGRRPLSGSLIAAVYPNNVGLVITVTAHIFVLRDSFNF